MRGEEEETKGAKSLINKPSQCVSERSFCANKRGPRPAGFVFNEKSNCSSKHRGQKDQNATRCAPLLSSPLLLFLTFSHFFSLLCLPSLLSYPQHNDDKYFRHGCPNIFTLISCLIKFWSYL